jgi:type IV pilus assembly protein PilC
MPQFRYGKLVQDDLGSGNGAKTQAPFLSLTRKPGLGDISNFTRQFAAMSKVGIPLVECLEAIIQQSENKALQAVIRTVLSDVQSGVSLAEALSRHPAVFNRLYCAMIRAGESAGILSGVLLRLADYQEKTVALQRRVKSAFAYPVLVAVVAAGALIALFTFVVPTFSSMLAEIGARPPLSTRIVIGISDLVNAWLPFGVILVTGLVIASVFYYRRSEKMRYFVDSQMLKLPVIGDLRKKSAISRFGRTFGSLLSGGVPIAQALEITAGTAGNRVLEKGFLKALEAIRGGRPLADPLRETGVFPPMVVQMIAVGEKGGDLPEMLSSISDYYDSEVDTAISMLTSVLEPALIVIMGVVISGVLISMYLPMFEIIGSLG